MSNHLFLDVIFFLFTDYKGLKINIKTLKHVFGSYILRAENGVDSLKEKVEGEKLFIRTTKRVAYEMNENRSKWIIHTKKKNRKMKRLDILQYFSCTSFKKGVKHNGDFFLKGNTRFFYYGL